MRPVILFLFSCFALGNASGQYMYYPDNSVKVYKGSTELTLAWCGGFDNPQFTMGDLNRDGLQDLVVFEANKGVKTFINRGTTGNPDYRYAPQYALNFPPLYNYLVLADYNRDNIPDLFHGGYTGFSAYKGYYNSSNQLCFRFYMDLFYNNDLSAGGSANAFCNPGDIPAIVDVDNDGDIDFVSYNIIGGTLNYYKNLQVENGLPADSIHIALKDKCWGKVYQGFYRTHSLAYSCNNSGLKPTYDTAAKTTHSGNTPCLFDWDMDNDYDYLDGSVSYNEMTFLKNGRTEHGGNDSMILQDTTWQNGGKKIEIPVWPAAFNIDIDQDGKKDLVVSPNAPNASENYKCVWFYKNLSTPGVPSWQFKSDSFLTERTIDAGSGSYPVLFDYNKDGKVDLFIGSDGYRQASGIMRSKISYYKNSSTTGNPSFTLQTRDFLSIDTFGFIGAAPSFGDIDNDGKADLVIGHTDGSLSYFKNVAATSAAQPVWQIAQRMLKDNTGTDINVFARAAPIIYDIDKDGKKDLLIGNTFGSLQYFQNVSTTAGAISLKLINTDLGQAKVDPLNVIGCFSAPFIGKIDASGKDYLLMGSNSGNIYQYDSIGSGDSTLTYPLITAQYSYIDSSYLIYNHPGSPAGVYSGLRSAPAVADIDNDGEFEMVVGDIRGGVTFYKRKLYDNSYVADIPEQGSVSLFPNPVCDELNINWSGMNDKTVSVLITNMQGHLLVSKDYPSNASNAKLTVNSLPVGLYICEIKAGNNRYYQKFTVLR
ncbi:MAG: T9SS type A sorting domain-containing protein [Taibaiella sp.]|nr:T9SS type A sorting domain-containing protein [Taibaiella sp.]